MQLSKCKTLFSTMILGTCILLSQADIPAVQADGGPDLTIETAVIDINDIPDDRNVSLRIYIDNNPGISELRFNVQADPRLEMNFDDVVSNASIWADGLAYSIIDQSQNKINIDATLSSRKVSYDNGDFITLNFKLPQDYRSGDVYSVYFIEEYDYSEPKYLTAREEYYRYDSFGNITSGKFEITGSVPQPELPQEPVYQETEISQEQQSEPEQNSEPPVQENNVTEATSTAVSSGTTVLSAVSSPASSSVTSVPVTSKITEADTVITTKEDMSATDFTSKISGSDTQVNKKTAKSSLIWIIPSAVAAATAIIMLIKRRKSNGK